MFVCASVCVPQCVWHSVCVCVCVCVRACVRQAARSFSCLDRGVTERERGTERERDRARTTLVLPMCCSILQNMLHLGPLGQLQGQRLMACPPTATPMAPLASAGSTLSQFGMLAHVVANAQSVTVRRFAAV